MKALCRIDSGHRRVLLGEWPRSQRSEPPGPGTETCAVGVLVSGGPAAPPGSGGGNHQRPPVQAVSPQHRRPFNLARTQ